MIVAVIGLGYIGLPTAALIASKGIKVVGVDVNQNVVNTINEGKIHIVEPDLDILVQSSVQSGNLRATTETEKADVFIVAVPTPFQGDHEPDLSYIKSAAKAITPVLEKNNLVILESTSPVGTTEKLMEWMSEERPDLSFPEFGISSKVDVALAHCPERVLPGNVVRELVENDRIIGGITTKCAEKAREFYNIFIKADCLITDSRTAELSKLVENSFRDVNIAFANELSLICDKLNLNVWELIKFANHHPRVNILQPGPGVGGHCVAVDPWFIVNSAPDEAKLIKLARLVNDEKPNFVIKKIKQAVSNISKDVSKLSIACLGLSFKPDIDDLRESPALEIAKQVSEMGFVKQYIVEPNIKDLPVEFNPQITELVELEEALALSDVLLLLVDHLPFKEINLSLLSGKQVIDTRGTLVGI
ncbi:MAG: UDP-N-acetyl-D-mannosamine dehydrogenase [Nitrososphaerales archaeon]|jgi:UDP-N-acetyl-D-mannosaminuronic acid dehydrogenase|nr:UDP-N-acetyl-D-mannosamine dehydrogenase [Nitrososphaerales archaeon]|tara:strand:- start:2730 stop:3983 length:1254 start_codon:yes stop_codon:yes gene_type:complete